MGQEIRAHCLEVEDIFVKEIDSDPNSPLIPRTKSRTRQSNAKQI